MKNKKALLINLIFAAVLLICAGAMLAARSANNAANSAAQSAADQCGASAASLLQAQLTYGDDNAVMDISLDEDATYDVDTGYYTVHIEVNDRAARFIDSPCPDHICENYGWISMEDQTAICAPAHAVLMIVPVSTS